MQGGKSKSVSKSFLADKWRNLGFYSKSKTTGKNHTLQKVTLKIFLSVTNLYKMKYVYLNKLKIKLSKIIFFMLLLVTSVTFGNYHQKLPVA